MNLAALEGLLTRFGLDEAARHGFAEIGFPPSARGAVSELIAEQLVLHLPASADAGAKANATRFGQLLAQVFDWDFSPPWISALIACWLEMREPNAEPEWVCELVAKLLAVLGPHLTDEARRVGCQQVLLMVAAALLRAHRQREDATRTLAAANDEATGLYRTPQAVSMMQSWIGANPARGFALCVVRITLGPVLLRLPLALERALLRQITARLQRVKRSQDALFVGAEWEWLLVLPGVEDSAFLVTTLTRALHLFDVPFDVFGREYRLGAHAGAARYSADGQDADTLLRSARIALHEAVRSGHPLELFRSEMDHSAARYAEIEHGFLEALRDDKLSLYLQPLVDCADGRCRHAEALLRWRHNGGVTVAPQFIVAIAEESGVRHRFARWLVTRAVRTLAELERRGMPVGVSINLTANDLTEPDLPDLIRQALALWRVPAGRLTIELTESAIIPDERHSLDALHALRAQGCRLAVDDFGTGYSSMAYLRQLPLNELKIDQLFVRRMAGSEQDREIVRSMLQLAHGLHLEVVAEGVEDEPTAKLLRQMGCHRLQGFLFGQAMPVPEFVAWQLKQGKAG